MKNQSSFEIKENQKVNHGGDSKILPLSSESLDMFREEESDVLHKLFSGEIIVTCYLEGREDFVQEAFVQVEGNEAEEMSVKQGEHLVPHRLLQN